MGKLTAFLAASLLFADGGTAAAATSCDNNPGSGGLIVKPGIVLEGGIETFKVGESAAELVKKIGPLLCANGAEELRVADVAQEAGKADPVERKASPERAIRFDQFIRGLEVRGASVHILLNIETNEVLSLNANFLPDRGLDHKPRLTAAQARAKVEARMGKEQTVETRSGARFKAAFDEADPFLAYDTEEQYGFAPRRSALVWIFAARQIDDLPGCQVSIDAATAEVFSAACYIVE